MSAISFFSQPFPISNYNATRLRAQNDMLLWIRDDLETGAMALAVTGGVGWGVGCIWHTRTPFKLWFHLTAPVDGGGGAIARWGTHTQTAKRPEIRMNSNYIYFMQCYVMGFAHSFSFYFSVSFSSCFAYYFFCCIFIQLCSLNSHLKRAKRQKDKILGWRAPFDMVVGIGIGIGGAVGGFGWVGEGCGRGCR